MIAIGSQRQAEPKPAGNREKWERVLAEFESSGRSKSAFCREKGIALPTFYYWWRKIKRGGQSKESKKGRKPVEGRRGLLRVEVSSVGGTGQVGGFEVVLWGCHRVLVPAEFDAGSLRRLLEVLREVC